MVTVAARSLDRGALVLFADILEYPRAPVSDAVRACAAAVAGTSEDAGEFLHRFADYADEQSLGTLQELYTSAFDLDAAPGANATCYPYVGHHLFGESHVRSRFLVELRRRFLEYSFSVEREMSDHIAVLLRFIDVCDDDELVVELIEDGLLPALDAMVGADNDGLGSAEEPSGRERYQQVLGALRLTLAAQVRSAGVEDGSASKGRATIARAGRERLGRDRVGRG